MTQLHTETAYGSFSLVGLAVMNAWQIPKAYKLDYVFL